MFVLEPMPVRKCLSTLGGALLALAVVSCSQTTEPEEIETLNGSVVEKLQPGAEAPRSPRREEPADKREKTPDKPREAEPRKELVVEPAVEKVTPDYRPVEMAAPFVPSAPGKRIARVSVPGPYVAVTFDDGPSALLTPQVLDIFNRHGARATFFVQGQNANRNRSLLARAAAEGHEIGSHTWSHINMKASSTARIMSELDRTADVIAEATGSRPKVMRPPYGSVNSQLVNMVYNRYGTPAILWDVDTNDWRKPGAETVVRRAVGNARPGSIILLHDIHASTIAAVEDIVTGLQARGFKLVTVSELIAMGRRAAGATVPAREQETVSPEMEAPAPAAGPALAAQQQQPTPSFSSDGAASIGAAPAELAQPHAAPAQEPAATETTQPSAIFY